MECSSTSPAHSAAGASSTALRRKHDRVVAIAVAVMASDGSVPCRGASGGSRALFARSREGDGGGCGAGELGWCSAAQVRGALELSMHIKVSE